MFYYALKMLYYASICYYAFRVYYAQNYASRIRQGLVIEYNTFTASLGGSLDVPAGKL